MCIKPCFSDEYYYFFFYSTIFYYVLYAFVPSFLYVYIVDINEYTFILFGTTYAPTSILKLVKSLKDHITEQRYTVVNVHKNKNTIITFYILNNIIISTVTKNFMYEYVIYYKY